MGILSRKLLFAYALLLFAGGLRLGDVLADNAGQTVAHAMAWEMMPGETLNGLAALFYPADTSMQRHFVASTLKLNQQRQPIKSGAAVFSQATSILVPDIRYLSSQPGSAQSSLSQSGSSAINSPAAKSGKALSTRDQPAQLPSKDIPAVSETSAQLPVQYESQYGVHYEAQYESLVSSNERQKIELERLNTKLRQLQQTAAALTGQFEALQLQEKKIQAQKQQEAVAASLAAKAKLAQAKIDQAKIDQLKSVEATSRAAKEAAQSATQNAPAASLAPPAPNVADSSTAASKLQNEAKPNELVPNEPAPNERTPSAAVSPEKPGQSADIPAPAESSESADKSAQNQLSPEAREVLPSLAASNANSPAAKDENAWIKILFPLLLTLAALITLGLMFRWKVNPLAHGKLPVTTAVPPPAFELTSPYKARRRASDLIRPSMRPASVEQLETAGPSIAPSVAHKIDEAHSDEIPAQKESGENSDALSESEKQQLAQSDSTPENIVASTNLSQELPVDSKMEMHADPSMLPNEQASEQENQDAYQSLHFNSVAAETESIQGEAVYPIAVRPVAELLAEADQHIREQKRDVALALLQGYVDAHPAQSVLPWLQMLDIHHSLRHRKTFNQLVERMHSNFDPQSAVWSDVEAGTSVVSKTADMSHILQELDELWMDEHATFNTEVLKEVVVLQEVLKTRDQYQASQQTTV